MGVRNGELTTLILGLRHFGRSSGGGGCRGDGRGGGGEELGWRHC